MIDPLFSNYANNWATTYVLNSFNNQISNPQLSVYGLAQQAQLKDVANQQQSTAMTNTLATFTYDANQLWQTSMPLRTDNSGNVYNQMAATSSAPNAVTAQAQTGATVATYNVSVTQVASTQQNTGSALTTTAATGLSAGNYTFNLNVNNTNYTVSFNVKAGDTQLTVLNNMANAINDAINTAGARATAGAKVITAPGATAGALVTASVSIDSTSGTSKLMINANSTGTANAFTLSDVTGNAVRYTGANNVSTAATNASYSVNGVSYTSSSNSVQLDNGKVTMNLTGTTSSATVTVATNNQAINNAVNNFVSAYNSLQTYVNSNQQNINNVSTTNIGSTQQNMGFALTSSAATGLSAGSYTFNLNVNNTNYKVSFNVSTGDNQQAVLNNMANAINAVGAGVKASYSSDSATGTSKLVINANSPGTTNAFTLSDVTGNAVSYTGANVVSTAATNASYSANGVNDTSSSNSAQPDNGKVTMNPQVAVDLSRAYNAQAPALRAVGIMQNPDGTLTVDQTALNNAIQNNLGAAETAFSGLAVSAGSQAQQIVANPLDTYANNPSVTNNSYLNVYNSLGTVNKAALVSSLSPAGQKVNLLG